MRKINFIVHHCTAGPQTQTVENILRYWRDVKGWKKPGYHFIVNPAGEAIQLAQVETVTNGVAGVNSVCLHFCYIGGVKVTQAIRNGKPENVIGAPLDNRTAAQKATLKKLTEDYSLLFPHAVIQGHRDFSPDKNRDGIISPGEWLKACPSYSVRDWLNEIGFYSKMPTTILTTTAAVNIRSGAGVAFAPVRPALPKGTPVKRLGESGGWTFAAMQDGSNVTGWIATTFLQPCL